MKYHLQYDFFPVGQGLFASGVLEGNSNNWHKIRWVYDCGTSSSQKLINDAITSLEQSENTTSRPKIDLVAISHFDKDHISGMGALLSKFAVDKLLLPYMPLSQRLMLAFEEGIDVEGNNMIQFFVNPVQYLWKQIRKARIKEIVFVPSRSVDVSAEQKSPSEPERGDVPWTIDVSEKDNEQLNEDERNDKEIFKDKIAFKIMREGTTLNVSSVWEFVPYNDAAVAPKIPRSFINAVKNERIALTSTTDKEVAAVALAKLKRIYDRHFGRSHSKRNVISLFLYGGPHNLKKNGPLYPILCERLICNNPEVNRNYYLTLSRNERISIIYTGDGYLNTPKKIKSLKQYFDDARIKKLHTFQVMHHGSRGNWRECVAKTLNPVVSVFCSDPLHRYGHPHESVLRDFVSHGPVLVDKNHGLTINFFFE